MDVVYGEPGLKVLLDEGMELMVMRKQRGQVFVSPSTFDALSTDPAAMNAFMVLARENVHGFRLMDRRQQPWATAVALWEADQDVLPGDRLTRLLEQARALVAASATAIRPGADADQVNQVMENYATAQRDLAELQEQANEIKALLEMAGKAIAGVKA